MPLNYIPIESLELQDGDYHLFITAYVGRFKLRMLIDTGASKSILTHSAAKKIKARLTKSEYTAAGLGTVSAESWFTTVKTLRIGLLKISNYTFGVLDLSHVNDLYKQLNHPTFDGILGCDLLIQQQMVIDLKKKRLYT